MSKCVCAMALESLKRLFVLQLLLGLVFVVSGLIINFLQLLSCVLWPFNRALYRRLNCRLAYSLWSRTYNTHKTTLTHTPITNRGSRLLAVKR